MLRDIDFLYLLMKFKTAFRSYLKLMLWYKKVVTFRKSEIKTTKILRPFGL